MGTRKIANGIDKLSKDHPHACGDKFIGKLHVVSDKGSSPRVWGQGYSSVI